MWESLNTLTNVHLNRGGPPAGTTQSMEASRWRMGSYGKNCPVRVARVQPARAAVSVQRAAYATNRVERQNMHRAVFGFPAWAVLFFVAKTWYSPAGLLAWPFASSGGALFF